MMLKSRSFPGIVVALITSVMGMAISVHASERPKLVVGVLIDGLDRQYIDLLRSHFGEGGFNRLLREGVIVEAADYGTNTDAAASASLLMTGASPSTTSVASSTVYDVNSHRSEAAMLDAEVLGNFTQHGYSPKSLAVSTLADELKIAGSGLSRVYSIAADPNVAVIMAGHSGNAALWLNDQTGNWAGSTYYKDFPTNVTYRNRVAPLAVRLDTMQWTPLRSKEHYPGLPDHLTHYPFRYVFPSGNPARYDLYKASPLINAEITALAGELIDNLGLGAKEGTDMVNIAYSVKPYDYTRSGDNRYELIDSYLRLDADLERLFRKAEEKAGKDGALFFIAATPPPGLSRRDEERWFIPYGEFSTKKARSLLNMYLIAKFGNGEWVADFHNGQFYLNHDLINEKNLSAATVRTEAADFLEKMSGVNRVVTIDEILGGKGDANLEAMRRNIYAAKAGDLFVEVAPGWETVDDLNTTPSAERIQYVHRYAAATAPVFILGSGIEHRIVDTPTDVRTIAPTVARLLRIRSPNAASLPPLNLKHK